MSQTSILHLYLVTLISSLVLAAGATHAQQPAYPAKPIRLILPFPPGGPSDILGRALSQKLTEQLGQQVLADNRPGAGGNLGMEVAAKSPPDGYTVVLTSPTMAISPSLYKKLNYDPQKDFAPVSMVANIPNIMIVHLSVPAKALKELIQLARRNPGKLNFGTSGAGSTTHLSVWFGILAPAATPRDITARLNAELHKALAAPDLRDRLAVNGIEPVTSTPEQFTSFARSETVRYAKVIREANISID